MTDTRGDRVLALLERAAAGGARCPSDMEIAAQLLGMGFEVSAGTVPGIVSQLAHDGRIEVRLYSHNWRVVVIRAGALSGVT